MLVKERTKELKLILLNTIAESQCGIPMNIIIDGERYIYHGGQNMPGDNYLYKYRKIDKVDSQLDIKQIVLPNILVNKALKNK